MSEVSPRKRAPGGGRKPAGTVKRTVHLAPAVDAALQAGLTGRGDTYGKVIKRWAKQCGVVAP